MMIFHPWYRYFGRLQGETSRTGKILTHDTTSRFIRNLNIPQDSRKRLGRQVESWQVFCCCILMKLSQKLLNDDPYHMTPPPGSSGTSTSSKTPGRDLQDRWSLDRVSDVGSWRNFHRSFWRMIPIIWQPPGSSGTSMSSKTLGRDMEDRWGLDRVSDVESWWKFNRSF